MQNTAQSPIEAALHVFKPDALFSTAASIFGVIILIVIGAIFTEIPLVWLMTLGIPIALVGGIWQFVYLRRQSISIYANGLQYRYGKLSIFVTWDNMRDFECRDWGKRRLIGIATHHPLEIVGGTMKLDTYFEDFIMLSEIVIIPTKSDGLFAVHVDLEQLQETDFGRVMFQYAPHLFEKGKVS